MEIDTYFIGQLVDNETLNNLNLNLKNVRINENNQLQFFLQINNELDIPEEYKKLFKGQVISCYESFINHNEWDLMQGGFFRDEKFKEFAEDKVFIFKVYLDDKNFNFTKLKVSKGSMRVYKKPKNISSNNVNTFDTIPIFNEYNINKLEQNIVNTKNIGPYNYLQKITTPYFISGDFLYGEVSSFDKYDDEWFISYDEPIKRIAIDFNKYKDDILKTEKAVYLDNGLLFDIFVKGLEENGEIVTGETLFHMKTTTDVLTNDITDEIINENQFIKQLIKDYRHKNLYYEDKQIVNFHTALKTKRLVILSGPSGTGKTQLVVNYAKSLGLEDYKTQFNLISVKPNWTDDSDLIGYLDTVNNIYRPSETGLLETLIKAKDNRKEIYIVCFDEMNLAKIEHYFSQFLSILELDDTNKRKISLYNKEMTGRVFNNEKYPNEIAIYDNVFFIGTINIDESTHSLPDKLLDRSNLIELNTSENSVRDWMSVMKGKINEEKKIEIPFRIDINILDEWNNWEGELVLNESEISVLEKIDELFNTSINLSIGYRTYAHINTYMAQLPKLDILNRSEAFDLQISQKIVPKIRGNKEELEVIFYDEQSNIFNLLDDINFPKTLKLLSKKKREIDIYGYTY